MVRFNGLAITLAWPKYMGKQTCSWYDPLMQMLSINKNFHYQVGHAALILINSKGDCFYFDCGRFHAPFQQGRIRDVTTDSDLDIRTKAVMQRGQLVNFTNILTEIQLTKACKGEGPLYASYCSVDFDAAFEGVKRMQAVELFPFGPFTRSGTNCCRFIQKGVLAGNPVKSVELKLKWLFPIIPMPMTVIRLIKNSVCIQDRENLIGYQMVKGSFEGLIKTYSMYTKENIRGTLPQPKMPSNIPFDCQWLAGEVSGSWFRIRQKRGIYLISRFSPEGDLECQGRFEEQTCTRFDTNLPYRFIYPSHCSKVTIQQNGNIIVFNTLEKTRSSSNTARHLPVLQ